MESPRETEWTRQLETAGELDLSVGEKVIVRVDGQGVFLPSRDLRIEWQHLAYVDGWEQPRFSARPYKLTLTVSRPWWAQQLAATTGKAVSEIAAGLSGKHAELDVEFRSWLRLIPLEAFGEWLTKQTEQRAPVPARLCITPVTTKVVMDRDSNRVVPLARVQITNELRSRLQEWAEAGSAVPDELVGDDATWEPFKASGRDLAADLASESGRPTETWWDCPDMP